MINTNINHVSETSASRRGEKSRRVKALVSDSVTALELVDELLATVPGGRPGVAATGHGKLFSIQRSSRDSTAVILRRPSIQLLLDLQALPFLRVTGSEIVIPHSFLDVFRFLLCVLLVVQSVYPKFFEYTKLSSQLSPCITLAVFTPSERVKMYKWFTVWPMTVVTSNPPPKPPVEGIHPLLFTGGAKKVLKSLLVGHYGLRLATGLLLGVKGGCMELPPEMIQKSREDHAELLSADEPHVEAVLSEKQDIRRFVQDLVPSTTGTWRPVDASTHSCLGYTLAELGATISVLDFYGATLAYETSVDIFGRRNLLPHYRLPEFPDLIEIWSEFTGEAPLRRVLFCAELWEHFALQKSVLEELRQLGEGENEEEPRARPSWRRVVNAFRGSGQPMEGSWEKFPPGPILRESSNSFGGQPKLPLRTYQACEVVSILEPLKIRTITKGHGPTMYLVRHFQQRTKRVLDQHPMFLATTRPLLPEDLKFVNREGLGKPVYLSLDYKEATDRLSMTASRIVTDELLDRLRYSGLTPHHEAMWRRVVHASIGQQLLLYTTRGQEMTVLQRNGQLMGSILSFPILCLINAYTVYRTHFIGTRPSEMKALINGDDGLLQIESAEIGLHEKSSNLFGLVYSLGKYYTHRSICTINSTVYRWTGDRFDVVPVLRTGLLLGQSKHGSVRSPVWDSFHEVIRLAPDREQAQNRFFQYHKEEMRRFKNVPICLPLWLGGLGMDVTGYRMSSGALKRASACLRLASSGVTPPMISMKVSGQEGFRPDTVEPLFERRCSLVEAEADASELSQGRSLSWCLEFEELNGKNQPEYDIPKIRNVPGQPFQAQVLRVAAKTLTIERYKVLPPHRFESEGGVSGGCLILSLPRQGARSFGKAH